ncbi:MAG: DUF4783 domain-containing protein [Flavobacteriales bacterium]
MTCLLSGSLLWSQSDISPAVAAALKKGDAAGIAVHLMPQVEVTIAGNDGVFDKAQVQQMLSTFFRENTPQAFTVKHQGTSKLDDQFRIGELTTSKGIFRVTFFMKKSNNTLQIKQLKIEPTS